jgi:hypothetical protein
MILLKRGEEKFIQGSQRCSRKTRIKRAQTSSRWKFGSAFGKAEEEPGDRLWG